jgi:hypothetical protein
MIFLALIAHPAIASSLLTPGFWWPGERAEYAPREELAIVYFFSVGIIYLIPL